MTSLSRVRLKSLSLLSLGMIAVMIMLTACGGSNTSTGSSANTSKDKKLNITVGGKLDTEAQLLTKMYVLLLRKAGFNVTEKAKLGTNDIVFNAINSGQIDLYPEFTATGLNRLNETTSHDPQQDYQKVKQGYEKNYKITWLDPAPLDDTYGICTLKTTADKLHLTKVSDLASLAGSKVIATPPDGKTDPNVLPGMKKVYGFDFPNTKVLDAALTYEAVKTGQADFNVCYTTSSLIKQDNFVLLKDDKNSFPIYNPAPLVRMDTLNQDPDIATALNPLAPKLTTDVSIDLQSQVTGGQSVNEVAHNFLAKVGLL